MDHEQHRPDQPRLKPPEMLPPPPQKCPRCDSSNTKFCYYNNYSLSQPRYFCKSCRRYWTHGGTLRNVPVGGGCRKTKRPRPSSSSSSSPAEIQPVLAAIPPQTLAALSTAHMRPFPPAGPTYYRGPTFLSTLASMQPGFNQGAAARGQYNAVTLRPPAPPLPLPQPPPPPPPQFPLQNNQYSFPSDSLNNPVARLPWPQTFINTNHGPAAPPTTTTTSSPGTSLSFWSGDGDSDDLAGPSFAAGFDPSSP